MRFASLLLAAGLIAACTTDLSPTGSGGTTAYFDLAADLTQPEHFYDFPYPSDLRLDAEGKPDLRGFPNTGNVEIVDDLLVLAKDRIGFPVQPVAYFRFSAPLAERDPEDVLAGAADSPILLVNVDPDSEQRGTLTPTVAAVLEGDNFVPANVLAVAPPPGFILLPKTRYAFVVMRALGDAGGRPLGVSTGLPSGTGSSAASQLYAPLWETLADLKIDARQVAAATVFTTADAAGELYELSTALEAEYTVAITDLRVDPDDGASHPRYCELEASVSYPQFQRGTPPFDKTVEGAGRFEFGADGLPKKQGEENAFVTLTLPKNAAMPAGGYPLTVYFHGSGGLHDQVVNRGTVTVKGGTPTKGEGPAHVLAEHGIATAASALPVNPERLPGAEDTAYLNISNLSAFRDTFRQGVIEQRMFLSALLALRIAPSEVSACTGLALPAGEPKYRFSTDKLAAMGQSMGGMYTNVIGSVEPRFKAAVPTGAGGFWSYFILKTSLIPGAAKLLKLVLNTDAELSFMHPAMHMMQTGWEAVEPFVYMPRLGLRPLPGHPARPVYQPVGKDDSYFPTVLYDAAALAYGHPQAGDAVWPSMQDSLELAGLEGIVPYPVKSNLASAEGKKFTGVVVQFEGDGIYDPHAVFAQLDEVKFQYGCFLKTFFDTGVATVPRPKALGSSCD